MGMRDLLRPCFQISLFYLCNWSVIWRGLELQITNHVSSEFWSHCALQISRVADTILTFAVLPMTVFSSLEALRIFFFLFLVFWNNHSYIYSSVSNFYYIVLAILLALQSGNFFISRKFSFNISWTNLEVKDSGSTFWETSPTYLTTFMSNSNISAVKFPSSLSCSLSILF